MIFWLDITNSPQVHFLSSIKKIIAGIDSNSRFLYTTRDFSETNELTSKFIGSDYTSVGKHYGKSYLNKIIGLGIQTLDIRRLKLEYDFSVSCGSERAVWNAYFSKKKSITFGDNDQARQWTHGHFADFGFFPDAISEEWLSRQGYTKDKTYRYHGYKEDIYLSFYSPDSSFLSSLPFDHYVVVRPENINANYIRKSNIQSIVPELLKDLCRKGYNVLFLPRYDFDKQYAEGLDKTYIPSSPINGLDACYYADAVLTGAGSFAREAACLGVPAFSFYAGKDLLSVDKQMISQGKMFFSRDKDEIMSRLIKSNRSDTDLSRCISVKDEISSKLKEVIFKK